MQAEFRTVRGLTMRYLRGGSGAPLVLLHGGSWGERAEASWSAVADRFATRRDVIAPDWLGFGGSDKVRDFAAPEARMLDQLAGLLETLGVETCDVIALSMGGSLVLGDLAADQPRLRPRRLVLVSAGGAPMAPDVRRQLFDYDGSREGMRRILSLVHHDDSFPSDDATVERWHAWSVEPGVYEAFAAVGLRAPLAPPVPPPDLARIVVPTLVCAGAHDRLKPSGWERDVASALPNARSALFAASGHLPQLEQPDEFVATVEDFLATPRDQE